jgi:hypothetical protein
LFWPQKLATIPALLQLAIEMQRQVQNSAIGLLISVAWLASASSAPARDIFHFINTSFENASPLYWAVETNGTILVHLLYDRERDSPNRAAGHWLFQVQAKLGADLTLVLTNFNNIWNGRPGVPITDRTHCYLSEDGRNWRVISAEKLRGSALGVPLHMNAESLYVARLEPYRISDLECFKKEIQHHRQVRIEPIGRTVEGRELEMIRVGNPKAPHRVVLRARAHPWEPGGSWVIQGMLRRLLQNDAFAKRFMETCCLYVMPMANKDGVVRGRTRFNSLGADLNRNWDRPADPVVAPENYALEAWLQKMIKNKARPHLAIDLHNDNSGNLHVAPSGPGREGYGAHMKRFEQLLRQHTWFTEGPAIDSGATFADGMLTRFGIDGMTLEMNCDWIAGLKKPPFGRDWEALGEGMLKVFDEFFDQPSR